MRACAGHGRLAREAQRPLLAGLCAVLALGCDALTLEPKAPPPDDAWRERVAEARAFAERKRSPTTHASRPPAVVDAVALDTPAAPEHAAVAAQPAVSSVSTGGAPPTRARAPRRSKRRPRPAASTHVPLQPASRATTPARLVREVVSDPGGPKIVEVRRADAPRR